MNSTSNYQHNSLKFNDVAEYGLRWRTLCAGLPRLTFRACIS